MFICRIDSYLPRDAAQYDEDMASRAVTLKELNEKCAVEEAEYALLKEHFDKIDADINRDTEETRMLAAVQRREAFGWYVVNHAATTVQKIYRGRKDRELVAKLKAKMKKKKGKKGGKGGKK